ITVRAAEISQSNSEFTKRTHYSPQAAEPKQFAPFKTNPPCARDAMPCVKIIDTSGGICLMWRSLALLCAFSFTVFGQDTRGSILGRVTDATGSNIAGADVHVSNVA